MPPYLKEIDQIEQWRDQLSEFQDVAKAGHSVVMIEGGGEMEIAAAISRTRAAIVARTKITDRKERHQAIRYTVIKGLFLSALALLIVSRGSPFLAELTRRIVHSC